MNARTAVITAGALAGAASFVWTQIQRSQKAPLPPAPGKIYEVGGEQVHAMVSTAGTGPTIIFEAALACPSSEWAWVLEALDGRRPYLAYDRPGNGWSSQHKPPVTAEGLGVLLRDLIDAAGLSGPFILVGHSVGGLLARTFATAYPGEVAGLVLVDSSHPDQLEESPLQREGMPLVAHGIASALWRTRFGMLREDHDFGAVAELPPEIARQTVEVLRHPGPWLAARREFGLWPGGWAEAVRAGTLAPAVPVAVVTAGEQAAGDPVHARLQRELSGLTSVSRHDTVPGADHDTLVMAAPAAARITAAIDWAADAVKEGV